jgi:ATP-dependent Clp protease ATP-binding subunit ClpA
MFERFTRAARGVVVGAQAEASALEAPRIGREHLLVALADTVPGLGLDAADLRGDFASGLDAGALAAIGIDLGEVRRRVEASFGPGALSGRRRGKLRFSRGAKKALELSVREAIALGERDIRADHVALGLLRDPGPAVTRALERRGRTPDALRTAVLSARRPAA